MGWYELAFQMALVVLGTGSLLLCYILYRFRLVPQSLAVLGLMGYLALIASGWLHLFGRNIGPVLFAPGALFELVFPLWLILRGINVQPNGQTTDSSGPARTAAQATIAHVLGETR